MDKQIKAYFPGPGEWCLQVATEIAYMCIVCRTSCEGCGEDISCKLLCEEPMKQMVFNLVMLKLFDYEVGVMPRLYGLKPLITPE